MTVNEMLSKMSSYELAEWMAYDRLEPFGEERGDVRSAMICQILANINRDPKKTQAFSVADFLPKYDKFYMTAQEEEVDKKVKKEAGSISGGLVGGLSRGAVKVYEGDAPPIRKLGKKGKSAKSGKRKF